MKIADLFKKKDLSTPEGRQSVFLEVENKRRCVQILMAHKNPDMKRKLGVHGNYDQWRDDAVKAILDDTFYLAVALQIIRKDKKISERFGQYVAEVNLAATAVLDPDGKLQPPKEGLPSAEIPVLQKAPALETDGIHFAPGAKKAKE